jgi:phosphatidylglycerophosphatase A
MSTTLEVSAMRRWADRLTLTASSALGLGYLPKAPGTWGTFAALPLWWAMQDLTPLVYTLLTALFVGLAVAISSRAEAIYGAHDVQRIVIDEVVGLLCTVIGVPWRWPEIIAAFVLFRLLDALKPPPINWFDEKVPGGLGVVIDDVAAGLIGCALLHLGCLLHGGWF